MVNDRVGRLGSTQRLARMSLLPAWLLAGAFPQAADPWRLAQPVARWRFAAVAAVLPEPALQFCNARPHRRHLSRMMRRLRQQQGDEVVLRELLKGGTVHRLLGIGAPKSCQSEILAGRRADDLLTTITPQATYPAPPLPGQLQKKSCTRPSRTARTSPPRDGAGGADSGRPFDAAFEGRKCGIALGRRHGGGDQARTRIGNGAGQHEIVMQREGLNRHAVGILVLPCGAPAQCPPQKAATRSRKGRASLE